MNREQFEFLRARELETFFHEKVNLNYKGDNQIYSEYEVTHVNNRPVADPITVGFCQFPDQNARLYLSADLLRENKGTAKIEFDLSRDLLQNLRTGNQRLMFLDALQSAMEDRPMANAENVAGQSILKESGRYMDAAINHPLKHLREIAKEYVRDIFNPKSTQKDYGTTTRQADETHLWPSRNNPFRWNPSLKDSFETDIANTGDPIIVRFERGDVDYLAPNVDYALTFSEGSKDGMISRSCTFTPVDENSPDPTVYQFNFDSLHVTEDGIQMRYSNSDVLSISFSEREREQEVRPTPKENDREDHWDHRNDHEINEHEAEDRSYDSGSTPRETQPKKKQQSFDSLIASATARSQQQAMAAAKEKTKAPVYVEPTR